MNVPDRRLQDAAAERQRRRDGRRRRRHGVRGAEGLRRAEEGRHHIRVIDCYSVQPIDAPGLPAAGQGHRRPRHHGRGSLPGRRHRRRGQRGAAPAGIVVHRLAVREIPRSGQPDELLDRSTASRPRTSHAPCASCTRRAADRWRARREPAAVRRAHGRRGAFCVLSLSAQAPAGRSPGSRLVARWPASRDVLCRSHLDFFAGRPQRPPADAAAATGSQRDPAWSPDGRTLAYAARRRRRLRHLSPPRLTGVPRACSSSMPGDERWPSWTHDGRIVFSHRPHAVARGASTSCRWAAERRSRCLRTQRARRTRGARVA
jgi:hypothetical protein